MADQSSSPSRVLNVGLIGCGEVGQVIWLPTLLQMCHLYRVTAICDVSPSALTHCGDKFRIPKEQRFSHHSNIVNDPTIDVVFVVNSDEYHAQIAVEAADAKKHVFIEKPMAMTRPDAQLIIDAQKRNGVVVFVGYMRRYSAALELAKKLVKEIKQIDYVRVRDIIGDNKLFVPDSGHYPLYFTDAPPPTVADKAARASTIASTALGPQRASSSPKDVATYRFLGSLGSHDLSAMRELIGLPKKCLVATRSRDGNFVNALFQYDGFVCSYETGIDAVKKFDAHIEVHGEGKRIKVTYDTPFVKGLAIPVTVLSTDSAGQHTEATLLPTYIDTYTLQAERLYGCIVKGEACKTGPEDAVQDLEVFDSIMANLVQM